ncbi:MFS transporter [Paenibacillus sp. TAB 01]|uniref:MFS transporter n=1 Tax=Paenibacillus sp. TAB 01 TaxID=3368988 RepID=UPI003751D779
MTKSFWLVFYSMLILMMSTNIPSPLYQLYQMRYGFSPLVLTLIFATYAVVLIPSLALFGKASDRYGRKKLIAAGSVTSIMASVLFACSSGIWMLFVARALQGIAVGMLSGAGSAALMELNPYPNKQSAALAASIATAGGTAIGPLIGGAAAQYASYADVSPYVVHWLLVLPCLLGIIGLRETVQVQTQNHSQQSQVSRESQRLTGEVRRSFTSAALTAMTAWAVTALFMSVIPSYIASLLGIRNLAFAGGVVFLMLGASVLTQLLSRNVGTSTSMLAGLLTLCLGLTLIVVAVPLSSAMSLLIGTATAGIGQGLSFKGSMQLVNAIAPPEHKAKIISSLYICVYIGVGIPIIGVGLLSAHYGLFRAIVGFTLAVGMISLILAGRLAMNRREENAYGVQCKCGRDRRHSRRA